MNDTWLKETQVTDNWLSDVEVFCGNERKLHLLAVQYVASARQHYVILRYISKYWSGDIAGEVPWLRNCIVNHK